jgi:hypothetical protein
VRSHVNEKLLLFIITPQGHEMSHWDAVRNGLIKNGEDIATDDRTDKSPKTYTTILKHLKVFVHQDGFQKGKYFHSWFVELGETYPLMTARCFSGQRGPLMFEANARVLTLEEVEDELNLEGQTLRWLHNEMYKPPLEMLNKMLTTKPLSPKDGFRKIRLQGVTQ